MEKDNRPLWDIEGAGHLFAIEPGNFVEPQSIRDARDGEGFRLDLGEAHLEFFPESNIVRYKDATLLIELLQVTSARPLEEWFRVESDNGLTKDALSFHPPSGAIVFGRQPVTEDRPARAQPRTPQEPPPTR